MSCTQFRFAPTLIAAMAVLAIVTGCPPTDDDESASTGFDDAVVIEDFTDQVVIPTYAWLAAAAGDLNDAVAALTASPTETTHAAAKAAWVATRMPWEQSEGFLFGPVDTYGIDPALDTWPVNKTDLDAVLSGPDDLTMEYVSNLDPSLKGFHSIEYLLFGEDSEKAVEGFTAREFEYLVALTGELAANADTLASSWTDGVDGGEPYGDIFRGAGTNSAYPSLGSAAQEIVEGMIGICDEVANGKIADPFDNQDPNLVESQFSFNSLADFSDNMRSVRNAFNGSVPDAETAGTGLGSWVESRDADLAAQINDLIDQSIAALGEISHPFRDAILDPAAEDTIIAAQAVINELRVVLEDDLIALVLE
ncbi:MAG: peptidase M75 [Deltaproteobacteria bacterium]|nr:peptidase M75 [Deltaproteobacteria bacterium]